MVEGRRDHLYLALLVFITIPLVLSYGCASPTHRNTTTDQFSSSKTSYFPSTIPAPSSIEPRSTSEQILIKPGALFEADARFTRNTVAENASAVLSPDWDAGSTLGFACAIYAFQRQDHPTALGLITTWQELPAEGDLWVGFADFERDTWSWNASVPLSAQNSLAACLSPQAVLASDGRVICAIILLGEKTCRLQSVDLGATAPQVSAVGPTIGSSGSALMLSAAATGTEPLSYSWTFSAGTKPTTSNLPAPTLILGEAGQHAASLRVSNPLGHADFDFIITVAAAGQIVISGITTDKLTHCISGDWDPESGLLIPSHLEINCINGNGAEVNWSASGGTIVSSGLTAYWVPSGELAPGPVTVSALADNGITQDSATICLRLTEAPIKWELGDPEHPGHFIEFNNLDLLEPLNQGGAIVPAPGRPMSSFCDGSHVVLHAYCVLYEDVSMSQLPQYHEWQLLYKDYHYASVLDWPFNLLHEVKTYLLEPTPIDHSSVSYDSFYCYCNEPPNDYWNRLGFTNSIPFVVLIDIDGFIRKSYSSSLVGDHNWQRVIQQLTAAPPYDP